MKKTVKPKTKSHLNQSTAVRRLAIIAIVSLTLTFGMQIWNTLASNSFDKVVEKRDTLLENMSEVQDIENYLTQEVRDYAANGRQVSYDNYQREINTDKHREQAVQAMKEIGLSAKEEELLNQIAQNGNNLRHVEEKAIQLTRGQEYDKALELLYGDQYRSDVEKIRLNIQDLDTAITERLQEELDHKSSIIEWSFRASMVCLVLVAIIQVLFILYIGKYLLKPMLLIGKNLEHMAQGDFDAELELEEDGTEVGQLVEMVDRIKERTKQIINDIGYITGEFAAGNFTATSAQEENYVGVYLPILEAINLLRSNLVDTLQQIHHAAEEVAANAGQVSASAQSLAQGATEQSSSVEELSAGLSEVSKQTQTNSENAQQANSLADDAGNVVLTAKENMKELGEAMQEISASSEQIRKVIKVIDDIAFQTNILALNAAVEAARAGMAGKGFAVVADEVRNLAGKSADAAKSTTDMIEQALSSVAKGQVLTERTEEAFEQVTEKVRQVVVTIDKISSVFVDEANQARQFAEGVDQISSVTQTVAAASEESAATSEELTSQAGLMLSLVNRFKFEENQETSAKRLHADIREGQTSERPNVEEKADKY